MGFLDTLFGKPRSLPIGGTRVLPVKNPRVAPVGNRPISGFFDVPIGDRRADLVNPRAPTKSGPLHKLLISPDDRLRQLRENKQNYTNQIARFGSQSYRPALFDFFQFHGIFPGNNRQAQGMKVDVKAVLQKERKAKSPLINIIPGWGGLDFAQAFRIQPKAPSRVRGAVRSLPPPATFGRRPATVPVEVQDSLARARGRLRLPSGAPVDIGAPVFEPKAPAPVSNLLLLGGIGLFLLFAVKR